MRVIPIHDDERQLAIAANPGENPRVKTAVSLVPPATPARKARSKPSHPPAREVPVIEAHGLTKHYGQITAVDHLTFDVRPGVVTGFLGPNGSGKSTTMRLILG